MGHDHRSGTCLHELVGPAIPQALQLARYQASRDINKDVVEVDENDVISRKPTPEEERIMVSNASVVSALEDLFSWIHKDKTKKKSQLSYIESWRFHRAMYRVWIVSTLYGYESARHGQRATGADRETQKAFFQKFTSQELIQISKVSRFLRLLASWAVLAECKVMGSLDEYDFDGLYLFAGPRIILRCYEEQSSDPLPFSYIFDDEVYEKFLLPAVQDILSQRNVHEPFAFVGSILDEVCGAHDKCHACNRDGSYFLTDINFYNENNWERLKGYLGVLSETFLNLSSNVVERPLFKTLREVNYDTLFHELFADRDDRFKDWTTQDWICGDCIQEFFKTSVFRWWNKKKVRANKVSQDCRHGYYCRDQCYDSGVDHAKCFNHVCEPIDLSASLAHYHSR